MLKKLGILLIAAVALCLPAQGIDVYMRILGQTGFADENMSVSLTEGGFFKIGAVQIGVENTINFGSTGGGSTTGKAVFKELRISKTRNQVSTDFFRKLVSGDHYDDVEIILIRSGGDPSGHYEHRLVMKFEMKLVLAESLDFSVSEGDSEVEEELVLQFGAIRVGYYKEDETGRAIRDSEAVWSRISNTAVFSVNL
ncbi:type VI secretion system tube protein Hcp [Haloferula sp.]|uniref:type VI secretion system tube protein Hcp n=1 Tax=Haloferula sp. TaxID=2497595 RepID=UPI00329C785A